MLSSLRIRHFQAWDDTGPIRLAALTLLLGEHGTGKSSLGRALAALQEAEPPLPPGAQIACTLDGGEREVTWPAPSVQRDARIEALKHLRFIQAGQSEAAPANAGHTGPWLEAMGLQPDHNSSGALHSRRILSHLTLARAGDTLWLEHPEAFLHPRAQAVLMDAFIGATLPAASLTAPRTQLIIETHSEAMLNRLQRRVAEGAIGAGDIALCVCRRRGQHAELEALRLGPYGDIENWPEDLFGHDMSDAIARTLAAMARRQADEPGHTP